MSVVVKPEMLRWARERANFTLDKISRRIPKFDELENGVRKPTLKQIEKFAELVHVPVGYLFLEEPPVEQMPIPDFRTIKNVSVNQASPNLLETIYMCQQRQEWFHEYAKSLGESRLSFIGSVQSTSSIVSVAAEIRQLLGFEVEERSRMGTWEEALRTFISQIDELGILVMVNGVVGNNTRRKLDVSEFRGFVLSDNLAPIIFINGADSKSGQMFTLAHELAHLWLGESGVSDIQPISRPDNRVEHWCNQVAAEVLAPIDVFRMVYNEETDYISEMHRLARHFKVSTLVALRRIYDAGFIVWDELWSSYEEELNRIKILPHGRGGNFYYAQRARISNRFAKALIVSALEGKTLQRDAFYLLGFSKYSSFLKLGQRLGIEGDFISGIST